MENPKNLRELLERDVARLAVLPPKNDFLFSNGKIDLSKLEGLDGYTIPLTDHDYAAKTPLMWNTLYERLGLKIRNIMLVANPERLAEIIGAFRSDQKYLGGGFGSGFKEIGRKFLDEVIPDDLDSINIVVNERGKLIGYNTDALGLLKSLEDKFREIGKTLEGSNYVVLGAGGVAKEFTKLLAKRKANRIVILNRTVGKGVEIADRINRQYGDEKGIAVAGGEDIIRGYALNSFIIPDAIINLTNKGSDGKFENYAAFFAANTDNDFNGGVNQTISRTIARELSKLNPKVVVADIAMHKSGKTMTLRIAENEGLENLVNGIPMVVNQAAPAYIYVQNAHPDVHFRKVSEEEALKIFREATK